MPPEGRVHLVGAGPGDPGLMTARALELIARADVILYDRLIPPGALDGARADAELVFVGKQGGDDAPSFTQADIERMLVERARAGLRVVRLKGGDPFVFGRGAEEARALRDAGLTFEVVPGVTAGIAAPAYAGIPVTHRDLASAVALVTGHEGRVTGADALDWSALAAFPGTLVLYMGVRQLPQIARSLLDAGRPDEPAAVVESGTLPRQRCVTATLATIAQAVEREGIRPPSVCVIGPVAALAEELAWLAPGPLSGLTVAVTRAREQAGTLAQRLRELGAEAVETPLIAIEPREVDLPDGDFDLVCCTSPNGARLLLERLGGDARALAGSRVAAVGLGTAEALRDRGIVADVVARRSVAEGLLEELDEADELDGLDGDGRGIMARRALIAGPLQSRGALADGLRARGAEVVELALYETVPAQLTQQALAALARADYVTFTSSSTARSLANSGARLRADARLLSIGPQTSATLRELGMKPHAEAARHDLDGLVQALLEDAARR